MQKMIVDDLEELIETLPSKVLEQLREREDLHELLEVVLDLGRPPEARFPGKDVVLDLKEVTDEEIQHVIDCIGAFGGDNRAGIEKTLHRISAIRNRTGTVVGLTLRVGRAVFGTIKIIEDQVLSGKSILLLGRPGVGKTTLLREVARVLADQARKRVIIVDTSNEIAGEGDLPHPAIGHARRMQVPTPDMQHAVMIEAVENHMPEVIVIDEMGTELEAQAARTIAERGVQLVATAHGNTLENLVMNPTLSDLIGGIQTVTLGDEEARRRRTQKSILERKAPPTFDVVVEIQEWDRVVVHSDVDQAVDDMLRGLPLSPESRFLDKARRLHKSRYQELTALGPTQPEEFTRSPVRTAPTRIHSFGVDRGKLWRVVKSTQAPVEVVPELEGADLIVTTKAHYRRSSEIIKTAEGSGKPVYVLRTSSLPQIEQFIRGLTRGSRQPRDSEQEVEPAVREAEEGAERVISGAASVDLSTRNSYIRRLQHEVAQRYNLSSASRGREPHRYVVIYR